MGVKSTCHRTNNERAMTVWPVSRGPFGSEVSAAPWPRRLPMPHPGHSLPPCSTAFPRLTKRARLVPINTRSFSRCPSFWLPPLPVICLQFPSLFSGHWAPRAHFYARNNTRRCFRNFQRSFSRAVYTKGGAWGAARWLRHVLLLRRPLYAQRAGPESATVLPPLSEPWNLVVPFSGFHEGQVLL
jgi:hypothetical protein